jgi:hypothetical protein
VLTLVIVAGLLIAGGAVLLTTQGDPINGLFRHVLTVEVIAGLLVWNLLAWAARRATVGKLPKMQLNSTATFIWGGFRVALFVATVTLLVCWVTALVIGLAVETAFIKAVVLLLLVTAFTGITAGAFLNSTLVVRRWRGHRA